MFCPYCRGELPGAGPYCPQCGRALSDPKKLRGSARVGIDLQSGREVWLDEKVRHAGTYIIGTPGTGKTTLLINMALQDIGRGAGVCFFDPHQDAIKELVTRIPKGRLSDVLLLDPQDTDFPFALNLLACRDRNNITAIAETEAQVLHLFKSLYGPRSATPSWGPRLESLLRYCILTLLEHPGYTILEIPGLITDTAYRDRLLRDVQNPAVHDFWENRFARWSTRDPTNTVESTLNKFDPFKDNPMSRHIVGQSESIDFGTAMQEGRIFLVSLPATLGDISRLIGTTIISQILHAAQTRASIEAVERRGFYIYADEYQRFATEDFATLLDEARKFAIGTTIAHQGRDRLEETSQNASLRAAAMLIFGISGKDSQELAGELEARPRSGEQRLERVVLNDGGVLRPPRDAYGRDQTMYELRPGHLREARAIQDEKADRLRGQGSYSARVRIRDASGTREYDVRTLPLRSAAGDLEERLALIRQHTRRTVCKERSVVEAEIRRRQEPHEPPPLLGPADPPPESPKPGHGRRSGPEDDEAPIVPSRRKAQTAP